MLGYFSNALCRLLFLSGTPSEFKHFGSRSGPYIWSGLTWVKTVSKRYRPTTLVNKELKRVCAGACVLVLPRYFIDLQQGYMKCEGIKEGKDQELIQSSTIPDPGHHMGK